MKNNIKKSLVFVLLLMLCSWNLQAQQQIKKDTTGVRIYFRQGQSALEHSFRDNGSNLDSFIKRLKEFQEDTLYRIENIRIVSGASPEGSTTVNMSLSQKRAAQIRSYFDQRITFERNAFVVEAVGIDWQKLTKLVEDSDMPYRAEVLSILYNTPEWIFRDGAIVDSRKNQLGTLAAGKAWQYMETYLFPELRSSDVQVVCEIKYKAPETKPNTEGIPEQIVKPEAEAETPVEVDNPIVTETKPVVDNQKRYQKPFYMAIKTNLLYDAVLIPNVGAEFYLGNGWSIGGNWMYAWWKTDRRHNYWRVYGGELDVRKYFGEASNKKPLTGHHLGIYTQMLTYDFELGGTGILSKLSYGAGIEYGYSLPVGRRLNIDFGIGVGYFGGEYKKYIPEDDCYVWQSTHQRHWFGPTKAEVSLVWLIGRGNYNENKGRR